LGNMGQKKAPLGLNQGNMGRKKIIVLKWSKLTLK